MGIFNNVMFNLNYMFQLFARSVLLPSVLWTLLFCFPLLGPVDTTHHQATLIPEMEFDDDILKGKEI